GAAAQCPSIYGWPARLHSLAYPLAIVIRSRRLTPGRLAPPDSNSDPAHTTLRDSYRRLLDELAGTRRILDRRFFVVVPQEPEAAGRRGARPGAGFAPL